MAAIWSARSGTICSELWRPPALDAMAHHRRAVAKATSDSHGRNRASVSVARPKHSGGGFKPSGESRRRAAYSGDMPESVADITAEQVDQANATGRTPVVFIHGLWLLPSSWDPWAALFD